MDIVWKLADIFPDSFLECLKEKKKSDNVLACSKRSVSELQCYWSACRLKSALHREWWGARILADKQCELARDPPFFWQKH